MTEETFALVLRYTLVGGPALLHSTQVAAVFARFAVRETGTTVGRNGRYTNVATRVQVGDSCRQHYRIEEADARYEGLGVSCCAVGCPGVEGVHKQRLWGVGRVGMVRIN